MSSIKGIKMNRKQAIRALSLQYKNADKNDYRALKAVIAAKLGRLYANAEGGPEDAR